LPQSILGRCSNCTAEILEPRTCIRLKSTSVAPQSIFLLAPIDTTVNAAAILVTLWLV
jgi:hypothetical protein